MGKLYGETIDCLLDPAHDRVIIYNTITGYVTGSMVSYSNIETGLRFVNFTSVSVCQVWCYVTGLKDLSKNFVFIWSYLRRLSNPAGFIVCLFVLLFYLFFF